MHGPLVGSSGNFDYLMLVSRYSGHACGQANVRARNLQVEAEAAGARVRTSWNNPAETDIIRRFFFQAREAPCFGNIGPLQVSDPRIRVVWQERTRTFLDKKSILVITFYKEQASH